MIKSFKLCPFFVFIFPMFLSNSITFASTIHVPTDHSTIQGAIDVASSGDTILVSDGTYTGEGNKNLDFKGKAMKVQSENGPDVTIIDCGGDGTGFYLHSGEQQDSVVSGLTIKNGGGIYWRFFFAGGAIYLENSSPTIDNCIIIENSSDYGSGIFISAGSPTISNCTITGNYNIFTSGNGGVYLSETFALIINCTIIENQYGGIVCSGGSPNISNCTIIGNWAAGYPSYGGGINSFNSSLLVSNCLIMNNSAGFGGGVSFRGGSPTIVKSRIIENHSSQITSGGGGGGGGIYCGFDDYFNPTNTMISNCLIIGNTAGYGGAISCFDGNATIINCTISGNSATEGPSGAVYANSSTNIVNSILWANSSSEINTTPNISFSIIEGGLDGQGNMDADPLFLNSLSYDYHLSDYSPAIGAGTSVGVPNTDIEGNVRPKPSGSNPDIGAYENNLSVRIIPPLNIFGFDVGNQWSYDSNIQRKITKIDQTTFPKDTFELEILGNGSLVGKEWYETIDEQLLFWGTVSGGILYEFDKGLLAAWFPLSVGEQKTSSAGVVGYGGLSVSMTVAVLSYEKLSLTIGMLDSYRLRYNFTASGPGGTSTQTFDWWVVPYLGVVKQQTPAGEEYLISFTIDGGAITQDSDADGDGLKDYQELIIYDTNPIKSDTNLDGMPDGWELNNGLDPTINDAYGDLDGDGAINLQEYNHGTDPNDANSKPSIAMPWIPLLLLDD